MAKILVTGGAGFIGSTLVDRLIEDGHDLVVVDNLASGKKDYINPQAVFYNTDIISDEIKDIFEREKFDYVCHLAAQIDVRKSVKNMELDNQINVLGALNILKNCHRFAVKKIVFSSSGGAAYGFPGQIPTPESHATNPVSPYGINKLSFEKYLNYFYKVFGQKYISLRLANVYGPRQYKGGEAGVIAIFINNILEGKNSIIYGDGKQTRDYIYVDDVVNAFSLSLDSDFVGELNIGTGLETNLLEIVDLLKKYSGKDIVIEHHGARLGEERRSCLDTERAKKELLWTPKVSLDDGIKKTLTWIQEQGGI